MSLVKGLLEGIVKTGEILHDFTVKDMKFVLRGLNTEEQILAGSMINPRYLQEKYNTDKLITMNDTVAKYRTVALVALAVKSVNGQSPVDVEKTQEEQFKQRQELFEELLQLDSGLLDTVRQEYNILQEKQTEFYSNVKENVEK